MDKKILFLLDGAHGQNNLYIKKDDIFVLHSETIKKIETVYTYFPEDKSFLIFGEPIAKEYDINYNDKSYKIIGEEINDSMFLCKLLDGFCGLILSNDKSSKDIMKSRLEYKLNLKDHLIHNELFIKYKQLLNNYDKSLSENIIQLIEICELLKSKVEEFGNMLLNNIVTILSKIQTNPEMINTLYNIRLAFRDYNIINFIKQNYDGYNNIIIVIGENHKITLETYCKKIFQINPIMITINEEPLKPSDIMSGGYKLKKYKFTFDLIKYLNK
jgi:hypothetical protein